jgi:hypothetical protein
MSDFVPCVAAALGWASRRSRTTRHPSPRHHPTSRWARPTGPRWHDAKRMMTETTTMMLVTGGGLRCGGGGGLRPRGLHEQAPPSPSPSSSSSSSSPGLDPVPAAAAVRPGGRVPLHPWADVGPAGPAGGTPPLGQRQPGGGAGSRPPGAAPGRVALGALGGGGDHCRPRPRVGGRQCCHRADGREPCNGLSPAGLVERPVVPEGLWLRARVADAPPG